MLEVGACAVLHLIRYSTGVPPEKVSLGLPTALCKRQRQTCWKQVREVNETSHARKYPSSSQLGFEVSNFLTATSADKARVEFNTGRTERSDLSLNFI